MSYGYEEPTGAADATRAAHRPDKAPRGLQRHSPSLP
jgi:hypothetical protein